MTRAQPDDGALPLRMYLLSDVRQVQRALAAQGSLLAGYYSVRALTAQHADQNDPLPHYLHYDYLRRRGEAIDDTAFRSAVFAFNRLPHY